ncbi:MAG: hypothetical protein J6X49_12990 [Victivallales bacterium]|nr:hypothetical protein [Victivallales bacterium]
MNNKMSYFSIILIYSIFIMFVRVNSAWSDGTMSGNLSMRGQVPVAVIDFLSAETNYLHSITSKTDNLGLPQSVCVDAYRQSAIYGVNNIPSGYAIVTATLQNGSSGALAQLEWYVDGVNVQTGGSTYNFSAAGRGIGKYKVEARLQGSVKALDIYVVNCSYIIAVQDTLAHTPIDISFGSVITNNFVGHASWKLKIDPPDASRAKPFVIANSFVNDYVGFHANNHTTVATTGISHSPDPTFDNPDGISPSKTKEYPVNIPNLRAMLGDTITAIGHPGDYILGKLGRAENLDTGSVYFDWSFSASRNCVSTALYRGKNNGLYIALSSLVTDRYWSRFVSFLNYTILIEYSGDAPCYLDASL